MPFSGRAAAGWCVRGWMDTMDITGKANPLVHPAAEASDGTEIRQRQ
jgi:hypothetical protein